MSSTSPATVGVEHTQPPASYCQAILPTVDFFRMSPPSFGCCARSRAEAIQSNAPGNEGPHRESHNSSPRPQILIEHRTFGDFSWGLTFATLDGPHPTSNTTPTSEMERGT